MQHPLPAKARIQSIDILRGLVMVIMAIDHVRDFFHKTAMTDDPLNLSTTTPGLYATRWITHFCAPIFVFLAGVSIYLQAQKKTKAEMTGFLIKRGIWLIIVEAVLITFALTFEPHYNVVIFQVIWATGISMVIMGLLVRLPYNVLLVLGLLIVFGHNLLDYPESAYKGQINFWWELIHHGTFSVYPITNNHALVIVYPFLPWTGIMILGFCFGKLFGKDVDERERRKFLLGAGSVMIFLFIVLRYINAYGDPSHWSKQPGGLYTFFSFMNVTKYPPSLLYLCATLSTAMFVLAFIEKVQNKFTDILNVYGRVPMFYYILHFYLIHLICMIIFFVNGHTMKEAFGPRQMLGFRPAQWGYDLWIVYVIWFLVVASLYPLCKKYDHYKSTHKKWWLSYM